ncbi:hypothetical protein EDB81DRAFT_440729 [Dactylonectria macrodidyma]|uniref:Uncharacterized protein n=1 Tax=Dactylonectria macrodidyma TaxID=307937 RepID=A0A9P9F4W5_9HYPO|nr:hypothetical protein EDB81DRAFT_440729 [Dactylonectria macrodidyma]
MCSPFIAKQHTPFPLPPSRFLFRPGLIWLYMHDRLARRSHHTPRRLNITLLPCLPLLVTTSQWMFPKKHLPKYSSQGRYCLTVLAWYQLLCIRQQQPLTPHGSLGVLVSTFFVLVIAMPSWSNMCLEPRDFLV